MRRRMCLFRDFFGIFLRLLLTKLSRFHSLKNMNVLSPEILERHASLCRVLAHPSRLLIVELLSDAERSVGEIADSIGQSVSTTSQHLRLLKNSNVLTTRRDGHAVFYTLKYPKLVQACRIIREVLLEDMRDSGEVAARVGPEQKVAGNEK